LEIADWFHKAAEQGNAEAEFNWANCNVNGDIGHLDFAEAAEWFSRAAKQGNAQAENALGVMYFTGKGLEVDRVQAYKWLKLASLQGMPGAATNLSICAAQMTPTELAAAQEAVKRMTGQ
jgi:TPR repeat protein